FNSTKQLSTRIPARAARTCSTRVTWFWPKPNVVRRVVPVTDSTRAGIGAAFERSVRKKATPESGAAGRKRSWIVDPVTIPAPRRRAGTETRVGLGVAPLPPCPLLGRGGPLPRRPGVVSQRFRGGGGVGGGCVFASPRLSIGLNQPTGSS